MITRLLPPSYLLLFCTVFGPISAQGIDDDLSAKQAAWFETNIRPLLASKCYSCHSAKEGNAEGGLELDTQAGWKTGGEHGPAVVPKDVAGSLIIRAVRYKDPDFEMPPDRKLTDRQVKLLEQWVAMGAPDPRTETSAPSTKSNPADPVAGKSHWAFQPLKYKVPDGTVQDENDNSVAGWLESPVDRFVLQKLQEQKLLPSPVADRRTLVRRVYLLLIGIPPTQDELNEFLTDQSPDALGSLVDRLLASPQFGATWGRHWLDLARYADSNGLDENFLFREAWRYRNWVIEAVNRDQPFDEFTREQIAGDLLPFDSIQQRDRQRIGAGFLVVGPKVLLGVNGELQKMDVADELISTVGSVFLGQTLGCARCHDHKFDPIPTSDYYALAGIFTSTEVMQTRYMLGQQRKMERLFGLGPEENSTNAAYEKYWRERNQTKTKLDQTKAALEALKKGDSVVGEIRQKHAKGLEEEVSKLLETASKSLSSATEKNDQSSQGGNNAEKSEVSKESNDAVKENNPKPETGKPSRPAKKHLLKDIPEEIRKQIVAKQKARVDNLQKKFSQPPGIPPRAMVPADKPKPANEAVRIAGQFNRKGDTVPRGFLQVVGNGEHKLTTDGSGRLELADWLTDMNGAGELTARVLANRVWHHLIGRGIVRTTDNFGRTGEAPTHPELLDYLASTLMDSDWSIKDLIREIVLSRTFQQSSGHRDTFAEKDPDNRWLWRAHRRRLTPESYRDSILFAARRLDFRPLDSTVSYLGDQATAVGANTNRRRTRYPNRSIYLPVIRNDLPEIFEAFDFADSHRPTGNRPETTVATTGLFILNDPMMIETSRALANEVLATPGMTDRERVEFIQTRLFGEPLEQYERERVLKFIEAIQPVFEKELVADERRKIEKDKSNTNKKSDVDRSKGQADTKNFERSEKPNVAIQLKRQQELVAKAKLQAWATACHAMFASSRFQMLE